MQDHNFSIKFPAPQIPMQKKSTQICVFVVGLEGGHRSMVDGGGGSRRSEGGRR
ncbi:hypothetical protein Leryth_024145 [Lithospermum erythrorhizon]|nr:hypothetical protein Leryth_024145 [Lithospermum erythrorhizon]